MATSEKQVPLDHCPFIQAFTEGAVTCEELRPDAAEYFALIRAQRPSAACRSGGSALPELTLVDRRVRAQPIDFPDRRRAALGEG